MTYPRMPFVVLPLTRLECPGWGKLLRVARISVPPGSTVWENAPTRTIRGKAHGFLMELNLENWSERMTYFLGRYYELPLQLLLESALLPGDRVVDVGGNIGMVTLLAARRVGPGGRVDTFEPNPKCIARIRSALRLNKIDWVTIHPMGLSNEVTELELSITHDHSGVGTFAPIGDVQGAPVERFKLKVVRGDELLLSRAQPIKLMKIDVEGFEVKALQGLTQTLQRDRPLVVLETVDSHLKRAGSSARELFDVMHALGYQAYVLGTRRKGLRQTLSLVPVATAAQAGPDSNVLWAHPSGQTLPNLPSHRTAPARASASAEGSN
jgi:FkbM family methyltransferase